MQRHAALGKRKCLFVLVAHQRDVRLVVHDAGEHVVSLDGRRQPLALTEGGGGFFAAPCLCEQDG